MPYELMYSGGSLEIYFQNILHNIVAKTFDAVCVVPNVLLVIRNISDIISAVPPGYSYTLG